MTDAAPFATVLDVYVTEAHPHYQVWADGLVVERFTARSGPPLTKAEQYDVASNYRDAIASGLLSVPRSGRRSFGR